MDNNKVKLSLLRYRSDLVEISLGRVYPLGKKARRIKWAIGCGNGFKELCYHRVADGEYPHFYLPLLSFFMRVVAC